ncbi:MAG: hypothetical protein NAOJABEB_03138 [Steroidobacteraceae bacterium]|nr:hypothetical protein [Steroidobacteraceae bacterium]
MLGLRNEKVRLPYPHPGQQEVRRNAKRFNWLSAGRRWRKTTLCMAIAVEAAIEKKGTYIWGAPTFDQVRIGFDETKRAVGNYAAFNISRMVAEFPNGGRIIYRSLDNPDNARGYTADGVVMDESAYVKQEAWYEVLRPMLIDTDGWAWLVGTPKGRNWYWTEHARALDRADSNAWQVPTLGVEIVGSRLERKPHPLENPDVPFVEVEHLFRTMPERTFQQEILAQFIESSGQVFRRVMEAATAPPDAGPQAGHEYIIGVDWARDNDWTVLTVLDTTERAVVSIDRFNQIDYVVQLGRLSGAVERWRPLVVIAESNSMGQPLIDMLRRTDIPVRPFNTTNASKTAAIDALALAFEQGALRIPPDPVLISELQAYEMERLPSGLMRYSAPEGMHDDCVMSLALAWSAVGTAAGHLLL